MEVENTADCKVGSVVGVSRDSINGTLAQIDQYYCASLHFRTKFIAITEE